MSLYFFTKDGSYGERTEESDEQYATEGSGWMAIPTSHWNQDMWELIHGWADEHRYELAKHFSMNIHHMSKGECKVCTLDAERLDGQYMIGAEPMPDIDYSGWATNVAELVEQGEL